MKTECVELTDELERLPNTFAFEANKYEPEDDDWLDGTVIFFAYSDEEPETILEWIMEHGHEKACLTSTISRGTIASDYEIFQIEDQYDECDGELRLENWEWNEYKGRSFLDYFHDGVKVKTFSGSSHIKMTLIGPHKVVVQR